MGLSFTSYKLSGDYEIVGLRNYEAFFASEKARGALVTTLLYAVIYVPMMLVVSLAAALVLQRIARASGFFRSALMLPYVTSFVLAGIVWSWLLGSAGPINKIITALGFEAVPFLTGPRWLVLTSLAVVSVWRGFGYSMLIFLAGLKSIPNDLYEAASLDGATGPQQFRSITLPLLRPTLFFVLVIETIAAFQVFDTVYVMTGGGPARASYTLVYQVYEAGFRFFDVGGAAAAGVVLFGIVLLVSLIQRLLVDRGNA